MFSEKVYEVCKMIPKGKVSTYKELAIALDCKAYRAVGNALNKNPHSPEVPCHRVVNSNGEIGGFSSGIKDKIKMLRKEGVRVKDGKVVDFENVFYSLKNSTHYHN